MYGDIDADDFDLFLAAFGHSIGDAEYNPDADYDEDGTVTFVDYQTWLGCHRSLDNQPRKVEMTVPDIALTCFLP